MDSIHASCNALGVGLTSTDGYYNGTVLGGWLPWSTYEVLASASGYVSDWTFVNTTAGITTTAPTITLRPVGVTQSFTTTKPPAGVWVSGRLVDSSTGYGIKTTGIQACSLGGGTCYSFTYGSNSLGEFNESLLPGLYTLSVTQSGYAPVSFEFNATANAYLDLGVIEMTPMPWVQGNAYVNPWGPNITVKVGATTTLLPLGPVAGAETCNTLRTVCGVSIPVSTYGGNFSVNAPTGLYDTVTVQPTGTAGRSGGRPVMASPDGQRSAPALRLLSRVRCGRPGRLALRILAAVVVAAAAAAAAGPHPAAPALVTGVATWLVVTTRRDLAPRDQSRESRPAKGR